MALGYLDDSKLYAIASAIRGKTSKSATMTVGEMPDEIESITTGAVVEPLSVTANGTYSAPAGQGYTPVTVSVPTGGGDVSYDDIATRGVAGIASGDASFIGSSAFAYTNISGAIFPSALSVRVSAFYSCKQLVTCEMALATEIQTSAFRGCTSLASLSIPLVTLIKANAFRDCYNLSSIDLPAIQSIENTAFGSCSALSAVHLESVSAVPSLAGGSVFAGCPVTMVGSVGYFYVPSSLYGSFRAAKYWSDFASEKFISV